MEFFPIHRKAASSSLVPGSEYLGFQICPRVVVNQTTVGEIGEVAKWESIEKRDKSTTYQS